MDWQLDGLSHLLSLLPLSFLVSCPSSRFFRTFFTCLFSFHPTERVPKYFGIVILIAVGAVFIAFGSKIPFPIRLFVAGYIIQGIGNKWEKKSWLINIKNQLFEIV
jgi:hypothetical protein